MGQVSPYLHLLNPYLLRIYPYLLEHADHIPEVVDVQIVVQVVFLDHLEGIPLDPMRTALRGA